MHAVAAIVIMQLVAGRWLQGTRQTELLNPTRVSSEVSSIGRLALMAALIWLIAAALTAWFCWPCITWVIGTMAWLGSWYASVAGVHPGVAIGCLRCCWAGGQWLEQVGHRQATAS